VLSSATQTQYISEKAARVNNPVLETCQNPVLDRAGLHCRSSELKSHSNTPPSLPDSSPEPRWSGRTVADKYAHSHDPTRVSFGGPVLCQADVLTQLDTSSAEFEHSLQIQDLEEWIDSAHGKAALSTRKYVKVDSFLSNVDSEALADTCGTPPGPYPPTAARIR
jgi:hypothetical protein